MTGDGKRFGKHLRSNWPAWERQCGAIKWRTGTQCNNRSVRGADRCKQHGMGGIKSRQAWKRYLLWVLLPESVRTNGIVTPVLDDEVEIVCNVLAQWCLTGDAHASEGVRMAAVRYLLDAVSIEAHPDPAALLTHLSREDATTAVRILRRNGLIR